MKRIYKTKFNATHFIKNHSKCGKPHSHEYSLKVTIEFKTDDWVDFHTIRTRVEQALADVGIIDHTENDLGEMTCERLSQLIREAISNRTQDLGVRKIFLTLYETEHFGVSLP